MAGTRSAAIISSARQRDLLERLVRSKKTSQQLVERCQIVLLSAAGRLNKVQAQQLGVNRQRVRGCLRTPIVANFWISLSHSKD